MKVKWKNILVDLGKGNREGSSLVKPYGEELAADASGPVTSPDKYLALVIIGRFVPTLLTSKLEAELSTIRKGNTRLPEEIILQPEIAEFFRDPNSHRASSSQSGGRLPVAVPSPPSNLARSREIAVRTSPELDDRPSGAVALQWLEGVLARYLPTAMNPPKSYASGLVLAASVMVAADGEIEDSEVNAVVEAFRRTPEIERTIGVSEAIRILKETLADLLEGNRVLARKHVIAKIVSLVGERELRLSIYRFAEELSASNSRGMAGPDERLVLSELARELAV